jgi:hypothetical protein
MRTTTRAATICAATAALLSQTVHVSAGPLVDRGHDRIDVTYTWTDFCGTGVTLDGHVEAVENGSFHLTKDGFPLFQTVLNGTNTVTTPDGVTAVLKFSGPVKDQSAVDNGDGTFTLKTAYNGLASEVIGPDGRTVAKDTGRAFEVAVVDYGGTPSDPEDDEVTSVEFVDQTGSHPIYESGLCAPLREALQL